MTNRHLSVIVTVAKTGSISKAAQILNVSQPSVSIAIKEVEDTYGIKIFERLNKRMQITPIGIKIAEYGKEILDMYSELEHKICDFDDSKVINIGTSISVGTFYMPEYIRLFKQRKPDVKVYVKMTSCYEIEQLILNNTIDIGIIEDHLVSKNVIAKTVGTVNTVPVCSSNHKFANQIVSLDDFLSEQIIIQEKGREIRDEFEKYLKFRHKSFIPQWESPSIFSIIKAISMGIGVSLFPEKVIDDLSEHAKISKFKVDGMKFTKDIKFIIHKDKAITNNMNEFYKLVYENTK